LMLFGSQYLLHCHLTAPNNSLVTTDTAVVYAD
jgi:hypothetical protein